MKYEIELVHVSEIQAGDTVLHNGKFMTVCEKNIKKSELMGTCIFGDSYSFGYKRVQRVNFLQNCQNG